MPRMNHHEGVHCIEDTRGVLHQIDFEEGYCVPVCGLASPAYFHPEVAALRTIPTCLWCVVARPQRLP